MRPYNKNKLDFRSIHCLFLGYCLYNKWYICLTPSGKTIISRHVIFNEDNFSFANNTNPFYNNSDEFVDVNDNNVSLLLLQRKNCDFVHATTGSDNDQIIFEHINNSYFETITDNIPLPLTTNTSPSQMNSHPTVTRSKVGVFKSKLYNTSADFHYIEPSSVKEASASQSWLQVMMDEYSTLMLNQT